MPKRRIPKHRRRRTDPRADPKDMSRDREGTRRLPAVHRALEAGLLNAPEPDRPLGSWR